jgi:uncharacterized protein GlcG (DUF336 family)
MIAEELLVLLGFELEDKDLKKFQKGIKELKYGVLGFGAELAAAATSFGVFLMHSVHTAESIMRASAAAGVGAEEFQRLAYAAKLSGVSSEELSTNLRFLSRNVFEATTNATSEASQQFRRFGINIRDANGQTRSTSDILKQISARYATMNNAQQKAALSAIFFGRSSGAITNFLNEGPGQIAKYSQELDDFFGVLSGEQLLALKEFGDGVTRITSFFSGLSNQVAANLVPALTDALNETLEFLKANRELIKSGVEKFVKGLVSFLQDMWKLIKVVSIGFIGLAKVLGGVAAVTKWLLYLFASFSSGLAVKGLMTLISLVTSLNSKLLLTALSAFAIPTAIGAALLATALIIEDFISWTQGKKSIFGLLFGDKFGPAAVNKPSQVPVPTVGGLQEGLPGGALDQTAFGLGNKIGNWLQGNGFVQTNNIEVVVPAGTPAAGIPEAITNGTALAVEMAIQRAGRTTGRTVK